MGGEERELWSGATSSAGTGQVANIEKESGEGLWLGGVEDFADGAAEGRGAIGLLEIAGRGWQRTEGFGGFGIAAGEKNGEARGASEQLGGGCGAAEARHD